MRYKEKIGPAKTDNALSGFLKRFRSLRPTIRPTHLPWEGAA